MTKVKIASDKTETEQNNLYFTRKDTGPFHNKAWLQIDKKKNFIKDAKSLSW